MAPAIVGVLAEDSSRPGTQSACSGAPPATLLNVSRTRSKRTCLRRASASLRPSRPTREWKAEGCTEGGRRRRESGVRRKKTCTLDALPACLLPPISLSLRTRTVRRTGSPLAARRAGDLAERVVGRDAEAGVRVAPAHRVGHVERVDAELGVRPPLMCNRLNSAPSSCQKPGPSGPRCGSCCPACRPPAASRRWDRNTGCRGRDRRARVLAVHVMKPVFPGVLSRALPPMVSAWPDCAMNSRSSASRR